MSKFKRIISLLLVMLILVSCGAPANKPADAPANEGNKTEANAPADVAEAPAVAELPAPRNTDGDFSAEGSNINNTNLKDYLNREDTVYIDVRDYGDYTKKHFKNFEIIPYFAYIFNEQAGQEGFPQLYGGTLEAPVAAYESSDAILEALFPKDKNLMIICQSGGRVAMLMKILEQKGYDMNKVYNIGGMAQYTAEEYRDLITDVEELGVEAVYTINATPVAQ